MALSSASVVRVLRVRRKSNRVAGWVCAEAVVRRIGGPIPKFQWAGAC